MDASHKIAAVLCLLVTVSGLALGTMASQRVTMYTAYDAFLGGRGVSTSKLFLTAGVLILIFEPYSSWMCLVYGRCGLISRAVIACFYLGLELIGGVLGYVERGQLSVRLQENMLKSLENFDVRTDTNIWDWTHRNFSCCGAVSYMDWVTETNATVFSEIVPGSCCKVGNECSRSLADVMAASCLEALRSGDNAENACPIQTKGCAPAFLQYMLTYSANIAAWVIGAVSVQIVYFALVCFLIGAAK